MIWRWIKATKRKEQSKRDVTICNIHWVQIYLFPHGSLHIMEFRDSILYRSLLKGDLCVVQFLSWCRKNGSVFIHSHFVKCLLRLKIYQSNDDPFASMINHQNDSDWIWYGQWTVDTRIWRQITMLRWAFVNFLQFFSDIIESGMGGLPFFTNRFFTFKINFSIFWLAMRSKCEFFSKHST